MNAALYGPAGFYRAADAPRRNFRTAAHTGAVWAEAIARLVDRVDEALGRPDGFAVVEMGAGGGELLGGVAELGPARWSLVGVDVAPRPTQLPARVDWRAELPASVVGVLIAVEWLDVVPVDVVERTGDGPRIVEVSDSGEERLGPAVADEDRAWLARWWPLPADGDRAEIGRPRDEAWRTAGARVDRGVAVAVDYPAVPARDLAGTLSGYKAGRQVVPVPDGSMDITAHVLFESLAADAGSVLLSQREALHRLGVDGRRPSYDGNASSYLSHLSRTGDEAELLDPGGLGGFTWLVHTIGTSNPLTAD
jgi:SAM-dependent MidA family methyltransferase